MVDSTQNSKFEHPAHRLAKEYASREKASVEAGGEDGNLGDTNQHKSSKPSLADDRLGVKAAYIAGS
jgi:hypothetical protein